MRGIVSWMLSSCLILYRMITHASGGLELVGLEAVERIPLGKRTASPIDTLSPEVKRDSLHAYLGNTTAPWRTDSRLVVEMG